MTLLYDYSSSHYYFFFLLLLLFFFFLLLLLLLFKMGLREDGYPQARDIRRKDGSKCWPQREAVD